MPGMVPDQPDPRMQRGDEPTGGHAGEADVVELATVVRPATSRRDRWIWPVAAVAAGLVLVLGIALATRPGGGLTTALESPSGASPSSSVAPPPSVPMASPGPTDTTMPCADAPFVDPARLSLRWRTAAIEPLVWTDGPTEPTRPDSWAEPTDRVSDRESAAAMAVDDLARMELATAARRCIHRWSLTFIDLEGGAGQLETRVQGGSREPGGPVAEFVAPPRGVWLVRIVVEFTGIGGSRWVEAYAHLAVGEARVIPDVSPLVPCGPDESLAGAVLHIDSKGYAGAPLAPGSTPPTGGSLIVIPLGAEMSVAIDADRCAVRWSIILIPRPGQGRDGGAEELAGYDSVVRDPAIAAQNRFSIGFGPRGGDWDLVGSFTFVDGTTLETAWPLRIEPFVAPALQVRRQGHSAVATAWIGCGYALNLRNGHGGTNSCGSTLPHEPLEALALGRGERLTFDAGAWSIEESWSARMGAFHGDPPNFETFDNGLLRSASSPPVDFPAPSSIGTWTLGLDACVLRDGNQVCGTWYVNVVVR